MYGKAEHCSGQTVVALEDAVLFVAVQSHKISSARSLRSGK